MFTFMDKAWMAGIMSFIAAQIMLFTGFEISPDIQAGIVSLVAIVVTYITPNK